MKVFTLTFLNESIAFNVSNVHTWHSYYVYFLKKWWEFKPFIANHDFSHFYFVSFAG